MTLKVQSMFRFDGGFKSAAVTRGLAVDNVWSWDLRLVSLLWTTFLGDAKFPLRLQALKTPMELFKKTKKEEEIRTSTWHKHMINSKANNYIKVDYPMKLIRLYDGLIYMLFGTSIAFWWSKKSSVTHTNDFYEIKCAKVVRLWGKKVLGLLYVDNRFSKIW